MVSAALDYLLSRPEVDPRHVGITGNSGGGTLTTWLCGLDPRWTMAAPACFVTTFRHNMENELPADTEQCPPRALALGLDHVDFLAAMAPKPVEILAQERDFFDVRGSQEAAGRLKRLYGLLVRNRTRPCMWDRTNMDFPKRTVRRCTRGSAGPPASPMPFANRLSRSKMTRRSGAPRKARSPHSRIPEPSSGSHARSRGNWPPNADSHGASAAQAVANVLKLPTAKRDAAALRRTSVSSVRHAKKPIPCPSQRPMPFPQNQGSWHSCTCSPKPLGPLDRLAADLLPICTSHIVPAIGNCVRTRGLREAIASRTDAPWFTCDVRGIGESQPNTCGDNSFDDPYGCDYFYAIHSLMLDRPYVGQKTHDLLCVLEWLATFGYTEIHLSAKGWGCLPATFAALLSPRVAQVTLVNPMRSYTEVAETEDYRWPLSTILPNVLAHFDLPDCYAELEAKQLEMVEEEG